MSSTPQASPTTPTRSSTPTTTSTARATTPPIAVSSTPPVSLPLLVAALLADAHEELDAAGLAHEDAQHLDARRRRGRRGRGRDRGELDAHHHLDGRGDAHEHLDPLAAPGDVLPALAELAPLVATTSRRPARTKPTSTSTRRR